ncbi:MAG: hypothetical protein H3C48_19685, partial [Chitinophagaceae bacterium]|nr:hypothetical protein [Chitinophagaceae bacterium]
MNLLKAIPCFFFLIISLQQPKAQPSEPLASPDGKLIWSFHLTEEGAPVYAISYGQQPL